jgi:hypothetical protein
MDMPAGMGFDWKGGGRDGGVAGGRDGGAGGGVSDGLITS